MHDEAIRRHIALAGSRPRFETLRLTAVIVSRCWPGGPEDRSEPAALSWLRDWRPQVLGALLPECSCHEGHCSICN